MGKRCVKVLLPPGVWFSSVMKKTSMKALLLKGSSVRLFSWGHELLSFVKHASVFVYLLRTHAFVLVFLSCPSGGGLCLPYVPFMFYCQTSKTIQTMSYKDLCCECPHLFSWPLSGIITKIILALDRLVKQCINWSLTNFWSFYHLQYLFWSW